MGGKFGGMQTKSEVRRGFTINFSGKRGIGSTNVTAHTGIWSLPHKNVEIWWRGGACTKHFFTLCQGPTKNFHLMLGAS